MMALNDSLAAKALPWHWDERCRLAVWGPVRGAKMMKGTKELDIDSV